MTQLYFRYKDGEYAVVHQTATSYFTKAHDLSGIVRNVLTDLMGDSIEATFDRKIPENERVFMKCIFDLYNVARTFSLDAINADPKPQAFELLCITKPVVFTSNYATKHVSEHGPADFTDTPYDDFTQMGIDILEKFEKGGYPISDNQPVVIEIEGDFTADQQYVLTEMIRFFNRSRRICVPVSAEEKAHQPK